MKKSCTCCDVLSRLADYCLERASTFSIFDWAVFKTCLISLGVLIGAAFAKLFKKLAPLMAIVFVVSWIYILWRMFFAEYDD